MPLTDMNADYLKRAEEARALASCASSFVAMDELLDIASAWRALAAEAERLARPTPIVTAARVRVKNIRLVPLERAATDAA